MLQDGYENKNKISNEKFEMEKSKYKDLVKNYQECHEITQLKWGIKEYTAAIKPLRRKGDEKMPKKLKSDYMILYHKLQTVNCTLLPFEAHVKLNTLVTIPANANWSVDLSVGESDGSAFCAIETNPLVMEKSVLLSPSKTDDESTVCCDAL